MIFETVGKKENPTIIMLNGSFSTGKGLLNIAEKLSDKYYIILPTYDGHHKDGGIFTTREKQANKIIEYLRENNIKDIALLQGASMGAEIGLTLYSLMQRDEFNVEHCLFDGGPFYHFPWLMRMFMRAKFRSMVHQAQEGTLDEVIEKFSNNKMVQWMVHGDISPYRWFIEGLAEAAPFMTDESINNESDACYTFDFPDISKEAQERCYFIWSTNEPAFTSNKKIRKHYVYSRYGTPGDLGHCGFISREPEKYTDFLRAYVENSVEAITDFVSDIR